MKAVITVLWFAGVLGAQEARPGASVAGVVVNSITGAPVRRAQVLLKLEKPSGGRAVTEGLNVEPVSTTTDAEGRFRLEKLEPGLYIVDIRRQGMRVARRWASTQVLTLAAEQELKGLRYELQPLAVIAGRVVDDEGEPVQAARVQVLTRQVLGGEMQWVPAAQERQTNDLGEFRITDVPPGRVLVNVVDVRDQRSGEKGTGIPRTYYPGVADPLQAKALKVAAGAELGGIEIRLRRVPMFAISGKALDATGAPLASDYAVGVVHRNGFDFLPMGSARTRRADGSFTLSGIPNGSYVLALMPMSSGTPNYEMGVTKRVDVNGEDVAGVVFRSLPPVAVQGHVMVECADGEKAKAALTSMRVYLQPTELSLAVGRNPQGRVQEDGSFMVTANASWRYRLRGFGGAMNGAYVAAIRAGGEDLLGKEIDLSEGGPGAITVVFRTDSATVAGHVEMAEVGRDGEVFVTLLPKDVTLRAVPLGVSTFGVGENGRFRVAALRPGEYLLMAVAGTDFDYGLLRDPEWVTANLWRFKSVSVAAGQTESVQLKPFVPPEAPE
ncbi:MAG: carboxypeptidase regulatory-like domain-containing protein [Acidobacteria bacterium]|nr:carboxypeptidase regulatory-like domain-containing protein [Acidobacteriota bacterium]